MAVILLGTTFTTGEGSGMEEEEGREGALRFHFVEIVV